MKALLLIANLRKDLDAPGMNFVLGRISDFSTEEHWEAVRAVQVKVAAYDPHGSWIDPDYTNNKEKNGKMSDDLHYTKEGFDLFGRGLARQAARMIKGEKADERRRPA